MSRDPRCAAAVVFAVALLLVPSCASGDDDSSDRAASVEDGSAGSTAPDEQTTTTTIVRDEPSAAALEQVVPYIEDLLARYDEAVDALAADPAIASSRFRDPVVDEFLSLFEEGSEFALGSLTVWASQAEDGLALRPVSPDRGINTTRLEGPLTRIDDDTVLFGHCTVQSYLVVEDGEETRRADGQLLPGSGRAVRVGGHWLLQEITTPPDAQGCLTQGRAPGGEG